MKNIIKVRDITFLMLLAVFASCNKKVDNTTPITPGSNTGRFYSVAFADNTNTVGKTYIQAVKDLTKGEINYTRQGHEAPGNAKLYASSDGKYLYQLTYGSANGGTITKYNTQGGDKYVQEGAPLNIAAVMGSTSPRWAKISDKYASLYNVTVTTASHIITNDAYVQTNAVARILVLDLETLSVVGSVKEVPITQTDADKTAKSFVFRIESPVISGNKIYYGLGKRTYDASKGNGIGDEVIYTSTQTLVLDFPSLNNPNIITSTAAKGATYGYRAPVNILDGTDVYQLTTGSFYKNPYPAQFEDTQVLKLKDGAYDDSYTFNVSTTLGEKMYPCGWFYVGNGIAYVPYKQMSKAKDTKERDFWAVARVDFKNKTAVKLNLPEKLFLQQYQSGVVIDGKFYMAIAPVGQAGNVYIFDPANTTADGFTKGATLQNGAGSFYAGIY